MKTFETVTDVLSNAQQFHNYAENFYLELQADLADERAKMLLGFMAEHEKKMEDKLMLFSHKSPRHILDTWMQFTVEISPESFFDDFKNKPNYSVDGISALGLKADSYLEGVFQEAGEIAPSADVKEMFKDLASMEDIEKHQLTKAANSLRDV